MRVPRWLAWSLFVVASGLVVSAAPTALTEPERPPVTRLVHQQQMQQSELRLRFDQAVVMLHARQYEHAVTALSRVIELAPAMPEAHVNMGYAMLGLKRGDAARRSFLSAIELRPELANAYYGLAIAEEQRADLEAALGGMRSYLHLARADAPHRVRARAALWEWEEALGRHPAGAASAPARR